MTIVAAVCFESYRDKTHAYLSILSITKKHLQTNTSNIATASDLHQRQSLLKTSTNNHCSKLSSSTVLQQLLFQTNHHNMPHGVTRTSLTPLQREGSP